MGVFTRSGINHLLPVINVVGNSALARQKDPTDIAPLKLCGSFAVVGQYHSQHLLPVISGLYPTV